MFEQIVVGTDGSDSAEVAVGRAIALAAAAGARLVVVSAYDSTPARIDREGHVPRDLEYGAGAREEVNMILSTAASLARKAEWRCRPRR